MSGKIGRKDFTALFGEDDSDEDNVLVDNKSTAQVEVNSTYNNYKIESKQKNESLYRANLHNVNKSEIIGKQKDVEDETKKRSSDIKEVTRNKKRIKSSEDKEFNKSKEKISDSVESKLNENGTERTEEMLDESNNRCADDNKKPKLKKMEIGGLVVKLLTPAYAEGRFDSKDTFKTLARNISHALANKDEQDIKEYIRNFLSKNEEFTSQTTL